MSAVTQGKVTGPTAGQTATPRPLVWLLVLLVLPLGMTALAWGRFGTNLAMWWPAAGVGVIAAALAPRRSRPLVALGVALCGFLANWTFGRDPGVAALLGLATGADALVTAALLSRHRDLRPVLTGLDDLVRFVLAALAGATAAGLFVAVGLAMDGAEPLITWRTVFASHLAAILAITPLGLGSSEVRQRAGRTELAVQWLSLALVVGVVFAPDQGLPLVYLVFVPLLWGAMRLSVRAVAWQVFLTALVITTATTSGWGPFANLGDASPQVVAALSQAAIASCALVALPLAVLKSQRAVALQQASSSSDLLDNILAAATSTVVIGTDLVGNIEFFNIGAEEISGWTAAEVVGHACLAIVTTEGEDGQEEHLVTVDLDQPGAGSLEALIEPFLVDTEDDTFRDDWTLLRRDGERRTLAVTISRRYDHGRGVGYVGIAEDVTEKRREEESAAAALDAERQLVDRLAQVDRTKNDFMSTVSHELRTPITSILGYSQLLLSDETGALPVMHRQIVGRIERNGRRLLGLIEDMLTMSQVEVGDFRYVFQRVDLRSVVQSAVETETSVFGSLGVQLTQDVVGQPVWVEADPDKLERALAALLDNAAKYSQPGDVVHLAVSRDDDAARVAVVDHGLGISSEDQEHLFDRFFRGSDAHARAIQGAGLGLSVTSMIVDGHGGSISCVSSLGEGSTFTVALPFAAEGVGAADAAADA
ncbi:ATP-binding protein [Nocardioides marmoribigeumensis]|uniref:histidine kinase n=1 Tax=Nocardioides marmoribigeumensis TaxID=433649 RepID=A0ABU2BVK2_9ACTN|nr:ATP-binding protein [Nocardioides marmoribigeumensis]MDR7362655.1 signal transduction histidine kinase [Nocardioides marmoribigeumensis]